MAGDHMVTKPRISKRIVDSLPLKSERYTVWDRDIKGFGIRVSPEGTKTYMVRYRTIGGADRLLTLAPHGVLTAEEARERARGILAEARTGGDPQGFKAGKRGEITVAELCDLYLAEGVATKKESTLRADRIRIARHIKPLLGSKKVADVMRGDIQRLMIEVGNGAVRHAATPHTRGGRGAASRTVGLLGGIFSFALDRRLVDENPVRGVKRYKDTRRERFLSAAELARLGDVLTDLEKAGGDPRHVAIVRLLTLTGARKNEIARLRWSEVDLERGMLRLHDSKTGPKVIRLGQVAQKLIARLPRTDGVWVFPDRRHKGRPVTNLDYAWVGIRERAGLQEVRIHDLRHSFASVGLAGGEGLVLIGKLLGHGHVSTTSRYAHLSDDPVRAAADRISDRMAEALGLGVSTPQAGAGLRDDAADLL